MSEIEKAADTTEGQEQSPEEFVPKGTMFLMILYIIIFAIAWGGVYFLELLARR